MRKNDREVTELTEIMGIIKKCVVCRLGMVDDGTPYIVPLNFGYEFDGAALTLYFHCAKEGRRIDRYSTPLAVCLF